MTAHHGSPDRRGDGSVPPDAVTAPGVGPATPAQRRELWAHPLAVLGAIALGGVVGAEARYALSLALPQPTAGWPWATLITNASGCLLIGALMVVLTEMPNPHPLVRPLLGVGVLGGYTTFSTYTVESLTLWQAGLPLVALGYVAATPLLAVLACALGALAARPAASRRCNTEGRA